MRPLLFYKCQSDFIQDSTHHIFLEYLFNVDIETYPIEDHRDEYDHHDIPEKFPGTDIPMPPTCWCQIPDPDDPIWPKLYFKPEKTDKWDVTAKFVASGDDILSLNINHIRSTYGSYFSGPGPW